MKVSDHPRPNIHFRDLTNVLLKPEKSYTIENGIWAFGTLAVIAAVCLAVVVFG